MIDFNSKGIFARLKPVENDKFFLKELFERMYDELPDPKKKK